MNRYSVSQAETTDKFTPHIRIGGRSKTAIAAWFRQCAVQTYYSERHRWRCDSCRGRGTDTTGPLFADMPEVGMTEAASPGFPPLHHTRLPVTLWLPGVAAASTLPAGQKLRSSCCGNAEQMSRTHEHRGVLACSLYGGVTMRGFCCSRLETVLYPRLILPQWMSRATTPVSGWSVKKPSMPVFRYVVISSMARPWSPSTVPMR